MPFVPPLPIPPNPSHHPIGLPCPGQQHPVDSESTSRYPRPSPCVSGRCIPKPSPPLVRNYQHAPEGDFLIALAGFLWAVSSHRRGAAARKGLGRGRTKGLLARAKGLVGGLSQASSLFGKPQASLAGLDWDIPPWGAGGHFFSFRRLRNSAAPAFRYCPPPRVGHVKTRPKWDGPAAGWVGGGMKAFQWAFGAIRERETARFGFPLPACRRGQGRNGQRRPRVRAGRPRPGRVRRAAALEQCGERARNE